MLSPLALHSFTLSFPSFHLVQTFLSSVVYVDCKVLQTAFSSMAERNLHIADGLPVAAALVSASGNGLTLLENCWAHEPVFSG